MMEVPGGGRQAVTKGREGASKGFAATRACAGILDPRPESAVHVRGGAPRSLQRTIAEVSPEATVRKKGR